jgi:hypothetical protein
MFQIALSKAVDRLHLACSSGHLGAFAIVGGFAVARWGRPRATGDIDFAIALGHQSIEDLALSLGGIYRKGDFADPLLGSISFSIATDTGDVPIQLLHFPPAWERVIFHDLEVSEIENQKMPFIDWKGLVLLKIYAGSALDFEDAREILEQRTPSAEDCRYLESKASALRVSKRLKRLRNER